MVDIKILRFEVILEQPKQDSETQHEEHPEHHDDLRMKNHTPPHDEHSLTVASKLLCDFMDKFLDKMNEDGRVWTHVTMHADGQLCGHPESAGWYPECFDLSTAIEIMNADHDELFKMREQARVAKAIEEAQKAVSNAQKELDNLIWKQDHLSARIGEARADLEAAKLKMETVGSGSTS